MKITDITTTLLSHYHPKPIQDGTTISPTLTTVGRSPIFVHIKTDEGTEGLGINQGYPGIRQIIENDLKELLINQQRVSVSSDKSFEYDIEVSKSQRMEIIVTLLDGKSEKLTFDLAISP